MGTPSATEPWGWQFDGHHAVINYFVLGDQVVMSPHFAGSEPVIATSGSTRARRCCRMSRTRAWRFVTPDAGAAREGHPAVGEDGRDNLTEAFKDNVVLDYAGLPASR